MDADVSLNTNATEVAVATPMGKRNEHMYTDNEFPMSCREIW